MKFGENLVAARKKHRLTTEALAEQCDVSRSYITLLETGKRLPSAKVLTKLAAILRVKPNVMLNWYLQDVREKLQASIDKSQDK